jgi:hypothetical protein
LIFVDPFEWAPQGDVTIALHVGTHMLVTRPEVIQGDFRHALAHEVAHYYWGSGNAPVWLREGGADFLASYALDWSQWESLADRRHDLDIGGTRTCATRGVQSIQQLSGDSDSPNFYCNYALGEFLLLNLYQIMGTDGSTSAWKQLYLLAEPEGRLVTEIEIHQAFLQHTPADQVAEFTTLYNRWHGGDFSE